MTLQYFFDRKRKIRTILLFTIFFSGLFDTFAQCPLTSQGFPFTTEDDDNYRYSWSAGIYLKSQVGSAQTLNKISFRLSNQFGSGSYTYTNIRIYIRHTSASSYSSSAYSGIAGFTKVYEGPFTFNTVGIYTINFSTAFNYNGTDNLEIMFENRPGTKHSSRSPWFNRTNESSNNIGKVGWRGSSTNWDDNYNAAAALRKHNLAISLNGKSLVGGTGCPLPVTLTDFAAIKNADHVQLKWQTGTEQNNDYFTVMRSSDLENWKEIGRVNGNGNSSIAIDYEFTDREPLTGTYYYQLRQTDYNGAFVEFDPVSVQVNFTHEAISVHPNPAQSDFFVSINHMVSSEATIQIADLYGKIVLTRKVQIEKGHNIIPFDNSELERGIYQVIVLYGDKQSKTMKLIKGN